MKWSWKIARLAGIDVYIHATFFILIAWIALSYWQMSGNLTAFLSTVGFIGLLFSCVVLHELGHALAARRYGIQTRHITLLPIGGVAMLEKMPDDPKEEIIVSLAGPAVNVAIVAVLYLWLIISDTLVPVHTAYFTGGSLLEKLILVNIVLAVFNLLPAFPMDGGRVLRATLSMRMDRNRATRIAASVGQGMAIFFGFMGLLYNPFLVVIALFIWIGAAAEAGQEEVKSSLSGMNTGQAMLTDFQILSPDEYLSRAIELTMAGSQKEFPVLVDGVMVGVLTQTDMLRGLQAQGEDALVGDWMESRVKNADINEPLESVLERLKDCECRLLSVTDAGRISGIINLDNIMELIRIQTALRERR